MHATKDQQSSLTQIKKRAEFLKIQGKGRKWVSHGLILQTAPNEAGEKRIGYTVSKRVDKSAVRRNRIKRRLRAAAADVLSSGALEGHDYILVGRPQTLIRPYEALCDDLRWCLRKMGLNK
ncbi:MAG TPA: ribonuclease P protein component [Alphaproteobacteria bacterium]|nr:ribonuclease P protein component [Alphaproteobacteria bacterium]USO05135.1 MAG: ribonuclease P protein component [Rhodospirillales bacterium]HOO82337.1 ribonuclease P protein component [Alphaproteobacteria bacterium]